METKTTVALAFYPFSYVLLDEYLNEFCWYCFNESISSTADDAANTRVPLLRCSGCKTAYFCSKECQSNGWSDHKAECQSFAKNHQLQLQPPDVEIRMLGRLTWRYKQILDGGDKKCKTFYLNRTSERKIMDLCSHDEDTRADEKAWRKFQQILVGLKRFYDRKFLLDDETIFQLHCRNFINRHGISDRTYLREIGKGLYLDLCWYDHSCRPNSLYTHSGFVAFLRPLSPNVINPADRSTTFYTYIDLLQSKEERMRCLSESWYFDCRCDRCIDESDHLLTAVKCGGCRQRPIAIFSGCHHRLKEIGSDGLTCDQCGSALDENRLKEGIMAMKRLNEIISNDDNEFGGALPTKEALTRIDALLDQYGELLPDCNLYLVRLLRTAIMRTDPNDAERMLRYHQLAVDCMRLCYPVNHPSLAYHLMNLGRFYGRTNQSKEAIRVLQEAKNMFEFTLGPDHYLTKQSMEEMRNIPTTDS